MERIGHGSPGGKHLCYRRPDAVDILECRARRPPGDISVGVRTRGSWKVASGWDGEVHAGSVGSGVIHHHGAVPWRAVEHDFPNNGALGPLRLCKPAEPAAHALHIGCFGFPRRIVVLPAAVVPPAAFAKEAGVAVGKANLVILARVVLRAVAVFRRRRNGYRSAARAPLP